MSPARLSNMSLGLHRRVSSTLSWNASTGNAKPESEGAPCPTCARSELVEGPGLLHLFRTLRQA